jgi:protease-4
MKSFLKYTLATIVGIILSSIIMVIISFGLVGILISAGDKPVEVKSNSILHFKIAQPIPDRGSNNPLDGFDFTSFTLAPQIGLDQILNNIEKAKTDDRIKGIYIEAGMYPPGIATIEEIRNALIDFKESGKFIIAFSNDIMLQSNYYLCSVADRIYMNPAGIMEFWGLRSEVVFYKGAMEKLGIDMQIIRHGEYKSAIEPFTSDHMSEASRKQTLAYMNSIWNGMVNQISKARNIPVEKLNKYADDLAINNVSVALETNLIDSIKYQDEVLTELLQLSGLEKGNKPRLVKMSKYAKVHKEKTKGFTRNKIAVVYASGVIGFGEGTESSIGSVKFVNSLRKARKDTNIKAIVIRVNSPGGSALASDIIWREVDLAHLVKPVVASFGNVAASGGYYIVSTADTIVSQPNTITGSIGVFGTIPNTQKLLNDKLGITIDVAKTNKHSDFGAFYRPLNAAEKQFLRTGIEETYKTFVSYVAKGRKMSFEEVDKIARGRVWSGTDAKENGLVDILGGLNKAIEIAAEIAGLDNYRITLLPVQEDPYQKLLNELSENIKMRMISSELGEAYRYYHDLNLLMGMDGIQTMLPYKIEIY